MESALDALAAASASAVFAVGMANEYDLIRFTKFCQLFS